MKINYKKYGNKDETVLFLHGWGANLNSFNFFCQNLKSDYCCVLVDFPGFGESEKLTAELSVFDYACEIHKLIKQLNLNKIIIVCHSFGARVAILLSTVFYCDISKLIIIDGAGIKPKFNLITSFKVLKYKLCKFLNKTKLFKLNLSAFGSLDYKKLNLTERKTFINVVNFNEVKYLKKIKIKTLILWGEQDKETKLYMAKIFKKKIKNSTLKVFSGCGHFCFLDKPNLVLYEIKAFLN